MKILQGKRMPDYARPVWMPQPLWDNLAWRSNDKDDTLEAFDQRNGRVYMVLTREELDPRENLWARVVQKMWFKYFIVHHPEKICC